MFGFEGTNMYLQEAAGSVSAPRSKASRSRLRRLCEHFRICLGKQASRAASKIFKHLLGERGYYV